MTRNKNAEHPATAEDKKAADWLRLMLSDEADVATSEDVSEPPAGGARRRRGNVLAGTFEGYPPPKQPA